MKDMFDPMAHRAAQPSRELAARVSEIGEHAKISSQAISGIVGRAQAVAREYKQRTGRVDLGDIDALQLLLDVTIADFDRQMKLLQWLMADATDFQHDVMQIHLHINRQTWRMPLAVPLIFASRGEIGAVHVATPRLITPQN